MPLPEPFTQYQHFTPHLVILHNNSSILQHSSRILHHNPQHFIPQSPDFKTQPQDITKPSYCTTQSDRTLTFYTATTFYTSYSCIVRPKRSMLCYNFSNVQNPAFYTTQHFTQPSILHNPTFYTTQHFTQPSILHNPTFFATTPAIHITSVFYITTLIILSQPIIYTSINQNIMISPHICWGAVKCRGFGIKRLGLLPQHICWGGGGGQHICWGFAITMHKICQIYTLMS